MVDYLDVAHGRAYEPAGRTDLVRVIEGDTRALIEFAPRVDFGRVPSRLEAQGDVLRVLGAGDSVQLVAPGVSWTIVEDGPHQRATATVELKAGEPIVCEMQVGVDGSTPWNATEIERRRGTMEYWSCVGIDAAVASHRASDGLPQRVDLEGALLSAHGRDPRGRDHEPPRGDPRLAQLGLPVLLGA